MNRKPHRGGGGGGEAGGTGAGRRARARAFFFFLPPFRRVHLRVGSVAASTVSGSISARPVGGTRPLRRGAGWPAELRLADSAQSAAWPGCLLPALCFCAGQTGSDAPPLLRSGCGWHRAPWSHVPRTSGHLRPHVSWERQYRRLAVLCADATLSRSAARPSPWTRPHSKLPSTLPREIRMPEAIVRTGPFNHRFWPDARPLVPADAVFQLRRNDPPHAPFPARRCCCAIRTAAHGARVLAPETFALPDKGAGAAGGTGKAAAGMDVAYTIQFTPDGAGDYACDLVVVTEREKFVVPVRARGCKPALDIPDRLELPAGVSKQRVTRQLLVCNVGTAEARFDLDTSAPFEVSPRYGELAVGGTLRVTISLVPPTKGSYVGELEVSFTNGERVVELHNA